MIARFRIERLKRRADVEGLIKFLNAPAESSRRLAAEALGEFKDPQATEPLVAALRHDSKVVREAAARAVREIGAPAISPLLKLAERPERARSAIRILEEVLLEDAAGASIEDLRAVATMPDAQALGPLQYLGPEDGADFDHWGLNLTDEPIDCSRVRRLAEEELRRRTGD